MPVSVVVFGVSPADVTGLITVNVSWHVSTSALSHGCELACQLSAVTCFAIDLSMLTFHIVLTLQDCSLFVIKCKK